MTGKTLRIRYDLISAISDGPIFSAYYAKDKVASRDVTIRVLKQPYSHEQGFIDALSVSIRQTATINHPGIEKIEELDHDAGTVFLVGAHSPGISLSERISRLAPFSVPVSIGTAVSILEGLDALHSAGVIHGDVGAHNIVVGTDGSTRLQMAGVWRSYSHSATAGAVVLPTLSPYLAPEVSSGGLPSTTSDVYAVGIILFELLAGRLPYTAETPVAMAMKHGTVQTPSILTYCPSAPKFLDEAVKRAMQKDPTLRYRDASELMSDLRMLQDALRFGRQLNWPVGSTAGYAASSKSGAEPPIQPVAPRMSAIRDQSKSKPKREYRGDVPMWFKVCIGLAFTFVCGIIFTWGFMNVRKPKLIVVPNLIGRDVADARQALRQVGLEMREVEHEPSDKPADTILKSDPEGGDKVRENGVVRVYVSTGSQKVEVPRLKGLTVDVATTTLKNLGLDADPTVVKVPSTMPADTVVGQDPAENQLVAKHTQVKLQVSTGVAPRGVPAQTTPQVLSNPTEPSPPDSLPTEPAADNDQHSYRVKFKLTDIQSPVTVKVEVEDADGPRVVLEQQFDVNDVVDTEVTARGAKATCRIYYDNALKVTKTLVPKRRATRPARKPVKTTPPGALPPPDDNLGNDGGREQQ